MNKSTENEMKMRKERSKESEEKTEQKTGMFLTNYLGYDEDREKRDPLREICDVGYECGETK